MDLLPLVALLLVVNLVLDLFVEDDPLPAPPTEEEVATQTLVCGPDTEGGDCHDIL